MTNKEKFDEASKEWDKSDFKLNLAKNITDAILEALPFDGSQSVLDFGCGTGLVGLNIAPFVKNVVGADVSQGMLEVFDAKALSMGLGNASSLLLDENSPLPFETFDVITSAMAIHHIKEPHEVFGRFAKALKSGGWIAIADLAKEDGTFHRDNTGVYHFGFDESQWDEFCTTNGFENPTITVAYRVLKEGKEYDVVLCCARRK